MILELKIIGEKLAQFKYLAYLCSAIKENWFWEIST
nr:MAG TPA: hypothetical protein [Crassvirales sp.]